MLLIYPVVTPNQFIDLFQTNKRQDDRIPTSLPPADAAYVHIPFCRRRCFYCDFPISVVGDRARGETSGTIAQYVDLLCQEIRTTPALGRSLQTVFFGGGTPSLLSASQLQHILIALDEQFGISSDAEISIEIDPGTFDLSQLRGYCSAGVNRVSLGVQSFDAELLAICGRTHTPEDVFSAVDLIHQAKLKNFSIDLISGLPHLTIDRWQQTLEQAIVLNPTHISVYDLTVEPGTVFHRRYQPGDRPLPSNDITAEMYRMAQRSLTAAGYQHYEISNYARSGYQCRHNRVYWENRPYYGFGMAAASYTNQQRFNRPRTRREYAQWLDELTMNQGRLNCEVTPPHEILLDTLMLGLRLAEGLSLADLQTTFGDAAIAKVLTTLAPHYKQGWVQVLRDRYPVTLEIAPTLNQLMPDDRICLSDPEGFLFSNVVLSDLFERLS